MKTLICTLVVLVVLLVPVTETLQAAGTVTVTTRQFGSFNKINVAWTSDASGAVSAHRLTLQGRILQVRATPGAGGTQPTDNYDLTLLDAGSIDVLGAVGVDLDNTTGTYIVCDPPVIITETTLDFVIANAGNAKTGILELWIQP